MKRKLRQDNGFVIASLIITTSLLLALSVIIIQLVLNNYRLAQVEQYRVNAQFAADAAADRGISELNIDDSYTGTSVETDLFSNSEFKSTYEISVSDGSESDEKIMNVIGRTYAPPSASTPRTERKYSLDLRGLGASSGTFSIVTGVGGLVMQNSSRIVDGEVYVNGSISMSNSATIGLSTNAVEVNVAHQNCPIGGGAGYPTVCSSGEPISINNPAHIYGDVCATNQTDGSGMSDAGLDTGCSDPPPLALPPHDRDQQKTNNVLPAETSSYYLNCNSNTAKRTWYGNIKIDGDVIIQKKCEVTIEGDVWITGSLTLANSAKLIVDDAIVLGSGNTVDADFPSIMVDSAGGIEFHNSAQAVSNVDDVGIQFLTYWSAAGCSPDCADVTGQDLFDSGSITTIYLEQSAQAPQSILYAKWTQVDLNNGGDIGALVGQTVQLRNSAAVTFGAGLSGGGGGGPSTWLVDHYSRDF